MPLIFHGCRHFRHAAIDISFPRHISRHYCRRAFRRLIFIFIIYLIRATLISAYA
jgi:hypothetical protein